MALTSFALRLAAREALRGSTWAGADVFDSLGRITDLDKGGPRFAIVIATDETSERGVRMTLTLSVFALFEIMTEDGPALDWQVPVTTPAAEFALDVLERQVLAVLKSGGGWANVFRQLAPDANYRVVRTDNLVAAQRMLVIEAMTEPEPKAKATSAPWQAWLGEVAHASTISQSERHAIMAALALEMSEPDWSALGLSGGVDLAAVKAATSPSEKPPRGKKGRR